MSSPDPLSDLPPGASPAAARAVRALMRPIDRFLELEAAGSVLLLVASSAALVWANSPWAASYRALWDTPIHVGAAGRTIAVTLHVLINDLLMAVFFFAVGLEIRRELHSGELGGAPRAVLPMFAAVGGMLAPAGLYLLLNRGALARGWGVPTSRWRPTSRLRSASWPCSAPGSRQACACSCSRSRSSMTSVRAFRMLSA